jgi:oxaloacetate decarboxylase alpha subunit
MDPEVKDKILSRPRAKKWENWTPPDPSLQEVRRKFGGPGVSDEELILRVYAGEDALKLILSAGAPKEYLDATQPLSLLVREISKRTDCNYVRIEKPGLSVTLGRENSGS